MKLAARFPRPDASGCRRILTILALAGFAAHASATGKSPQGSGDAMSASPIDAAGTATRMTKTLGEDGVYRFQARFRDFEGIPRAVSFAMPAAWSREAAAEFGVSEQGRHARHARCKADPDCQWQHEWRRYYREQGMRLRRKANGRLSMFVDVPAAVDRNRERVRPVAEALRDMAARNGRDTDWSVAAAIALVQDGLTYGEPEQVHDGRRILDFYPPPRALERGFGDCDTKSALLAAILNNLTDQRIVGVRIPDHYLLGIAGDPAPDQLAVEHQGETYILVEASGPAIRRPGDVSDRTRAALAHGEALRIDPMF